MPALAPLCLSLVGVAGVYRRGHLVRLRAGRGGARRRVRDQVHGGDRGAVPGAAAATSALACRRRQEARAARPLSASRSPACSRSPDSSSRTRTRCSTGTPSGRASSSSPRRRATAAASSAWSARTASSTTSARSPGGSAGCRRWRRPPVPSGSPMRDRRLALVLVPAPVVFLIFMGLQDRFFARWLLPIYPLLCLLAAWAAVAGRRARARGPPVAGRRRGRAAVRAGPRVLGPQRRRARPRRHARAGARLDGREHPGGRPRRDRADRARPVGDGRRPAVGAPPAPATAGSSGRPRASARDR